MIQNISKANKKAQIKDKQAARLRNHSALGLDPINSSSPQSKPSLVNDVKTLEVPSVLNIIILGKKVLDAL